MIGGLPLSFLIGCCSTSKRLRWRSAASEIHCFRRSTASEIPGDRILGGQPLPKFIVFGGLPLLNFIEWAVFRCKVAHAQRRTKNHWLRIHNKNECVWTARGEWLPPQRRTAHAEQTDCEAGDRPERRVTLRSGRPRTGHTQVFESHSGRPPKQNGGLFPLETMLKFQQYRSAAQSLPTDGREADHHTTPLSLKPREQRPQAKRSLQSPRPPEAPE